MPKPHPKLDAKDGSGPQSVSCHPHASKDAIVRFGIDYERTKPPPVKSPSRRSAKSTKKPLAPSDRKLLEKEDSTPAPVSMFVPPITPQLLREHAERLHAAIEASVIAAEPETQAACCDEFQVSAKSFAALILAQRIQHSFSAAIDPTTGKSTKNLEGKLDHAREIKSWLQPWNFGLVDPRTQRAYQIRGRNNGTSGGAYGFRPYGKGVEEPEFTAWSDAVAVLSQPQLTDVTEFVHHGLEKTLRR
ncbi:MAG: hypothetical protein SFV23_16895 [Planctomycetaceae bacterium]|nr:hypothetical protein [Planctomycetaceae bacterium]